MSRLSKLASLTILAAFIAAPAHALTLGQVAKVAATAQTSAFNTIELASYGSENSAPEWNRVQPALESDMATLQACLTDKANCEGIAQQGWHDMIHSLLDKDAMTQLMTVNAFFNRWQYRTDEETYGVSERWASPLEFMTNSGDCEDYAIAKYATLTFLGFDDEQMRIMAVVDNGRGGIGHSILSVALEDGKTMILDNLSDMVYAEAAQPAYAPRFAVNMESAYVYAAQPRVILASLE
jgi:predicted transglutaminase-like cysteine proteinase